MSHTPPTICVECKPNPVRMSQVVLCPLHAAASAMRAALQAAVESDVDSRAWAPQARAALAAAKEKP